MQGARGAHRDGMVVSVWRKGCLVRDSLFVAQTHTQRRTHRKWSCCKDRECHGDKCSKPRGNWSRQNSHSVTTSSLLSSASPLLTRLLTHRLRSFSFSFCSHASFPDSQEREGNWVPWGPVPALVQLVEVRECIQAGAMSFVQGQFLKGQCQEGGVGGADTI